MKLILLKNQKNIELRSGIYAGDIFRRYLAKLAMPFGATYMLTCVVKALDLRTTKLFTLCLANKHICRSKTLIYPPIESDAHMVLKHRFVKPLMAIICMLWLAAPSFAASLDEDLVYQAFFGGADEIITLVDQGADPASVNKDGVPAICLAATRKSEKGLEAIKALLASGTDVNQTDGHGQSALFYAARVGNLDAVKLLLESGADYYLTDKSKNIARNVAYQRGYMEVFEFMDSFVDDERDSVIQEYDERGKQIVKDEKEMAEEKAKIQEKRKEIARKEREMKAGG